MLEEATPPAAQRRVRFPAMQKAVDTCLALIGLACIDVALKLLGFPRVYRIVKAWPTRPSRGLEEETVLRVCAAVSNASFYYLRHSWCFARSIVTTCLLRLRGVEARLVIGCTKIPFRSHAWVEVGGRIVNDRDDLKETYGVLDVI